MADDSMLEALKKVAREIRAAAILREAGRLASDSSNKNGPIYAPQIAKALAEYKQVLIEMSKQGW